MDNKGYLDTTISEYSIRFTATVIETNIFQSYKTHSFVKMGSWNLFPLSSGPCVIFRGNALTMRNSGFVIIKGFLIKKNDDFLEFSVKEGLVKMNLGCKSGLIGESLWCPCNVGLVSTNWGSWIFESFLLKK